MALRRILAAVRLTILALTMLAAVPAFADCPSNPYTLQNGQTADASQLMANFNNLLTCFNSLSQPTPVTPGTFAKADYTTVAFTKTGAGTISLKAGTVIEVAGSAVTMSADTAVTMPSLTAGTDYAVYACTDGTIRADANFTAPAGYTTANSRKIGGFHYALANLNVDATPNINAYSLWDLKWRPAAADPRGMVLVAGSFWADIYLLGTEHIANGTSAAGKVIADGGSPPKKPLAFGGDGSASYGDLSWWTANEVLAAYGKRPPTYQEFGALAYGVTENQSVGSDPGTTQHQVGYTSKWGIEQATGVMWTWGSEFGGPYASAAWANDNGGRGQDYNLSNVAMFGGYWSGTATSGSRSSHWDGAPSASASNYGARGVCSHLALSN